MLVCEFISMSGPGQCGPGQKHSGWIHLELPSQSKKGHILLKRLYVVVDAEPRSSPADQSLFGEKMFLRVKTISCGGTNRIYPACLLRIAHLPSRSTPLCCYRFFAEILPIAFSNCSKNQLHTNMLILVFSLFLLF